MAINQNRSGARLKELCQQRLSPRRLILASNRGPVEYYLTEDRQLGSRRGSGGVVTALTSLGKYVELDWIASTMGEGDRQAALFVCAKDSTPYFHRLPALCEWRS